MANPPSKPLEEMTGEELRAWKDWLLEEGRTARPFAWARTSQPLADHAAPVSEAEYDYEPVLERVIERSADGKRYIIGVRNAELQRLQNLPYGAEPAGAGIDAVPLKAGQLRSILNTLPDAQRRCLKLFYGEGFSSKEVAEHTGFTERQVKSHLRNGLRGLRNGLRGFSSAREAISEEDLKSSLLRSLHPLTSR
jgi:DNA-directed RNA polymerase specialized sigma24 family protein